MNMLILISLFTLWSSMFSIGKLAMEISSPLFVTAARMLFAGLLTLGFLAWKKRDVFSIKPKQVLSIAIFSIFSMYLSNIFEFWGLKHMSAAKTCFFYSLSPFFTALFSYLHFGEKMNGRKWLGMAIGFIGFIPVLASQKGSSELLSSLRFISWPEISVIAASICAVYGWVLLRVLLKKESVPVLMVNGSGMLFGGCFALIHSLFADSWTPLPIQEGSFSSFAGYFFLMVFVSNIFCYNVYGYLLKKFTATFMSFMGLLYPILASMNSWLLLGEPISLPILFSTGVVSIGLWLFYSAELKQGYILQKAAS